MAEKLGGKYWKIGQKFGKRFVHRVFQVVFPGVFHSLLLGSSQGQNRKRHELEIPNSWRFSCSNRRRLQRAFAEPEPKLAGGGFWPVAAVGEVVVNREGKVAADCAWGGLDRVCCSHHGSDGGDCTWTGDRHGDDWTGGEVVHDVSEERSFFVLGVVFFYGCARGVD